MLTAIAFLFLFAHIGFIQRKHTYEDSKIIARELARKAAVETENYLRSALMVARSMKEKGVIYWKLGAPRSEIVEMLRSTLVSNLNFLATWVMWEPNAYDNNDFTFKGLPYYDSEGHFSTTFFKYKDSMLVEKTEPDDYNEDYYTIPKRNKSELLIEPYYYIYEGYPYEFFETSVVVPIIVNDGFLGVFAIDIDLDSLQKKISRYRFFNDGFLMLISGNGTIVSHPDTNFLTHDFFQYVTDSKTNITFKAGNEFSLETVSEFTGQKVFRFFYPARVGNNEIPWYVVAEIPISTATYRSKQLQNVALATLVIGLLLLSYLVVNIYDRTKYEKQLIAAKELAEKDKEAIQKLYYELQASEEEIRATNEELYTTTDALKETNAQLTAAKEKAEESNKLKTAFLQNISHEVRTPLNAICGFSKILQNTGYDDEERSAYISIIINSSNQLLSIINDIITISSIETGQAQLNLSNVKVNSVLDELHTIFDIHAKNKGITLAVKKYFASDEDEVLADRAKLAQVLTNLIDNAIKFTHQGVVEFGYTLKNSDLMFFVKDTGIGIEKNKQEIIFDRFAQADDNIRVEYGGTGLGLSICKGFIELFGGKIWLESVVGEGTIFYFTIPYKPVNELKSGPKDSANQGKSLDNKILIAEDQKNNFEYLKAVLKNSNFNVIHAQNGQEAVDLFYENTSISLILMDIKMPIMDGYEAAKIIKELNPSIPIIAQTAYAIPSEIEKYRDIFDDYLTKPVYPEKLIETINKYLLNQLA